MPSRCSVATSRLTVRRSTVRRSAISRPVTSGCVCSNSRSSSRRDVGEGTVPKSSTDSGRKPPYFCASVGRMLSVPRGAALYIGALIGPGLLLVPSLAAHAAGPASILAWAALLVLSAPLAITFAALGVRHPVAGGVAAYVRAGLGDAAASVTGAWFMTAILIGGPAV